MFNKLIAGVKGVMRKMGFLRALKDVQEHKKVTADEGDYNRISMWKSLYEGKYDEWHKLSYIHNNKEIRRTMLSMGMGKVVSKYIAKLIFNEKCQITVSNSDSEANEFVQDVFAHNNFLEKIERYLEYFMALGGGAMKVYHDGKEVKLAFAAADAFFPLSNDSENIDEAVFVNSFQKNKKYYTLLEWNEWEGDDYIITNELYESASPTELGNKVALSLLYPDLEKRIKFENGISRPLFVYVKTNIANNKNMTSPLGLSVFANALDTMKTLDMMFDAFYQEIKLGKRRIIVPASFLKTATDEAGNLMRFFDPMDEAFVGYDGDIDDSNIIDASVDIRANDYISSINAMLRIFAMQSGLSAGTFTFDENGIKTATEVISEKSETYQTKNSHSMNFGQALRKLIISILEVGKMLGSYRGEIPSEEDITVDFDDSIAQDEDAIINRYTNGKNQGMVPLLIAIQRAYNIPEKEAELWVKMIRDDEQAGRGITDVEASQLFGGIEE
ncbi:phage portal protein [Listeria booriae]|uniref:Phage portal protein n=1 Tax=Listeria booriae TaxID=1552123 RepID=A0A7X1CBG8_9LIST|nr:phage portal protein [Listeria booriae]MBC1491403.1 phage portal protein [Listeria booriae]